MEADGSSAANAREHVPGARLWLEGQGRRSAGPDGLTPLNPCRMAKSHRDPDAENKPTDNKAGKGGVGRTGRLELTDILSCVENR